MTRDPIDPFAAGAVGLRIQFTAVTDLPCVLVDVPAVWADGEVYELRIMRFHRSASTLTIPLTLRPCTIRAAKNWIGLHHRRLPRLQGAMWAVAACRGSDMVGVAAVGHPARMLAAENVLCVLRVAEAPPGRNACSMLYGACSRAARAMGATGLVTYTHQDEPGTSLRASGWVYGGLTSGGDWGRGNRPRKPALYPDPKHRWWSPWSLRAVKEKV